MHMEGHARTWFTRKQKAELWGRGNSKHRLKCKDPNALSGSKTITPIDAPAIQFEAAVPGVNETPRRTSAKPAVRTVVKLSVVGRLVAAKLSVIMTSLFGSAPWSPFPLTVEVTAQIVTVPSPFTRPVMLRRPSVAGDHGSPVAGLLPVG